MGQSLTREACEQSIRFIRYVVEHVLALHSQGALSIDAALKQGSTTGSTIYLGCITVLWFNLLLHR